MTFFPVFLIQLLILAFFTRHSSSYFLRLFYSITSSEKGSVILFSLLFFPGTLVHELAHWLMAKLLFVRTSGMEFIPQVQGDAIKLGSVSIAKTDPLRRLLIGVAPVIVGLSILLGSLWGVRVYYPLLTTFPWWSWIGLGYLVLVIASTMFSSRKDLEGALGVVISIGILLLIGYLAGFGWIGSVFYQYLAINLNDFFKQLSILMLIPLSLNIGVSVLGWGAAKRLT